MFQEFQQHIEKNFSFLKGKKVLVAVSGGIDSVVLSYLVNDLTTVDVSLAHCNFQLRGTESDLDEVYVKELGETLGLKTYTIAFQTDAYSKEHKLSTQLAARQLRYDWFHTLLKEHSFDYILTAHHADDNLETFLINLSRGTGLDGLTGIPEVNDAVVRPLLPFSREEIEAYAKEKEYQWREDASNKETKYLRNKLRLEVIPKLKEVSPNFLKSFKNTTKYLKEDKKIIDQNVKKSASEIITSDGELTKINIKKTLALPNAKAYLYRFLKDYNFTEWEDVYALLQAQSGKQIVTKSHILLKDRDFLLLLRTSKNSEIQNKSIFINQGVKEITKPIHLSFENVLKTEKSGKNIIYVDKKSLNFPLILRKWQEGDYFYPTGMKGKKKVSKYFKDEKLSMFEKQNIWLLCSKENEVIWIVNKRLDRRFLPTTNTTELFKISTLKL
ncbi:tRNA lysidine(34) synthetase TilS [uncultured Tenacibaculum sp.]|uniref:tRNA lysidine(34) synthetase TilS n=1 Tax=uncultured Tenacibaculum sp. TaxID=174713 RepID=UPI0026110825|nr:tRNA lysidine(34) synthetase TilS [uncultured Tenacibaculum sp.]